MAKSKNFEKVMEYYKRNLWNLQRVYDAVQKQWITKNEYKEITGKEFK